MLRLINVQFRKVIRKRYTNYLVINYIPGCVPPDCYISFEATGDVVDPERGYKLFSIVIYNPRFPHVVNKLLHAMRNGGDELTKLTTIDGKMEKHFRDYYEHIQHLLDMADDYASREY